MTSSFIRSRQSHSRAGAIVSILALAAAMLGTPLAGFAEESAQDDALLELFTILLERGSISKEEYDRLVALIASGHSAASGAPGEPGGTTSPPGTGAAPTVPVDERLTRTEKDVDALGQKVEETDKRLHRLESKDDTTSELFQKALADKWYERLSLGGYTQVRYTDLMDEAAEDLNVPADRSVSPTESLIIRRGRVKLSGDVSRHLYFYSQIDFAGSVGGNGDFGVQARDLYADVAFDKKQEYRVRAGLSKVPFGWVNLQSSQNRAPLERPDAINSAAEGERDLGVYFMYAPVGVRKVFKELVRSGLKGSGDYGMIAVGGYNGQGPNRSDLNGEFHYLARFTYPFVLDSGQAFEVGIQGYRGNFVPSVQAVNPGTGPITPTFQPGGVKDERLGVSAIWYPKPIGFEAEWNVGHGPELSDDFTSIDDESLKGGYFMASYRVKTGAREFFPFARWQHYEGGRKFGRNAPHEEVTELDLGLEFSPWPEVELTLMYTHTYERTNTRDFPYDTVEGADRLGFQLQWNY